MKDGLSRWMDSKGYETLDDFMGKAVANTTDWKYLDMNYKSIAHISQDDCIKCGRCYVACEDTSHQSIFPIGGRGHRHPHLQGQRGGMRRLQPVRDHLSGARLYYDGRSPNGQTLYELSAGSA